MGEQQPDFEQRVAEARAALAALRSEVNELHVQLQGAPVPRRARAAESQQAVEATVVAPPPEAPATAAPPAPPPDNGGEPEVVAAGPLATTVEKVDPDASLPEQLVTKSDVELAKTFEIAASLELDAHERRDADAAAYWRTLAAAVLEEARRRPELGESSQGSAISLKKRRQRRVLERLAEARERYTARDE